MNVLPERFRSAALEKQIAIKVDEGKEGSLKTGCQAAVSRKGRVEDVESDLLEAAQYMSSQLIRDNLLWLILGEVDQSSSARWIEEDGGGRKRREA